MLPVGVKVPVGCAKATLQNDRTGTDSNAANLLVIFVPQFLLGPGLVTDSIKQHYLAHVFENLGKVKKRLGGESQLACYRLTGNERGMSLAALFSGMTAWVLLDGTLRSTGNDHNLDSATRQNDRNLDESETVFIRDHLDCWTSTRTPPAQ